MIKNLFMAAIATSFLVACTDSGVDQQLEGEALMDLSRKWSDLVASGDLEAGMEYWADDAVMLAPDMPVLDGKDAIRDYVEGAAAVPGFRISWQPQTVRVSKSGDMAYMIERNVIEVDGPEGGKVVTHGKVVTVWRKGDDGAWKNVVDAWNVAPPPTGD